MGVRKSVPEMCKNVATWSLKCPDCEVAFSQKCSLKTHVRIVHDKVKQACPHCEKSFCQGSLKTHILAVHDKIKFNCNFCKESYSEKKELWAHAKAVHLPTKEKQLKKNMRRYKPPYLF